jgi:dienelactone hydrolase
MPSCRDVVPSVQAGRRRRLVANQNGQVFGTLPHAVPGRDPVAINSNIVNNDRLEMRVQMRVEETALSEDLQGVLLKPEKRGDLGVVVLGGSSGTIDVARARLFAERGAVVIALRWFGGPRQPPGICEVPLETFTPATDRLVQEGCDRIAYVGTSKGAEAALLVAVHDHRITTAVAFSPSSIVWAQVGPGLDGRVWPQRSSFTHNGHPLPFVPYDEKALVTLSREPPVAYLDLHLKSLRTQAARLAAAAIPIERSRAEILLVAGGDDALWPSEWFARALADRLAANNKRASLISHPKAGHRVLLPGETTSRSTQNAHGGTDVADRELGRAAWKTISTMLHLPKRGVKPEQALGRGF